MRFAITFSAAMLALGTLTPSVAFQVPVAGIRSAEGHHVLSWTIADQGNRALLRIKAEARHSVRHLELAPLPGRPQALPLNSMLASVTAP